MEKNIYLLIIGLFLLVIAAVCCIIFGILSAGLLVGIPFILSGAFLGVYLWSPQKGVFQNGQLKDDVIFEVIAVGSDFDNSPKMPAIANEPALTLTTEKRASAMHINIAEFGQALVDFSSNSSSWGGKTPTVGKKYFKHGEQFKELA